MEPRAYLSGAAGLPPPFPETSVSGYPQSATDTVLGTVPGPWWFFMAGEESRNLQIEGKVAPTTSNNTGMLQAILNIAAGAPAPSVSGSVASRQAANIAVAVGRVAVAGTASVTQAPNVALASGGASAIPTLDLANLPDITGNGNDLIAGGAMGPTFISNPFGIGQDGLSFENSMQLVGPGADWNPPAPSFTYQFRIVRDTGQLGVQQIVFGRWSNPAGGRNFQFLCYFDSSNNLNFITSSAPNIPSSSSVTVGAITDGFAHAIEFAMTGGTLYAYLDGVLIQTQSAVVVGSLDPSLPMLFGTYNDIPDAAPGGYPLYGTFGDFMVSDIARHTGSSYTVSTSPAVADANTVALIPMSSAAGTYIETPAYQGNCLLRGSFAPASGGWANPDGPLPQIGGGWYFTASAFNGTYWTVWGITAPDINTLLSGGGTIGAAAIQTPAGSEGDLAGNGSVVAFQGQYWHFYHDGQSIPDIRYSTGTDLGAPFSPSPGNVLFTGNFDPWVRVSPDGTTLTMYMGANASGSRYWYKTTSTDGTTWTTPVLIYPYPLIQGGYSSYEGEFSVTNFTGNAQWGFSDAAPNSGTGRDVIGWVTENGTDWMASFVRLTAAGTGNDAGGNPYIAVYDSAPTWDNTNRRLVFLCTHSTNVNESQPTDSDIGVWFANVAGT